MSSVPLVYLQSNCILCTVHSAHIPVLCALCSVYCAGSEGVPLPGSPGGVLDGRVAAGGGRSGQGGHTQVLSGITRWQVLPGIARCYQVISGIARCYQIIPGIAQYLLPGIVRYCQVLPSTAMLE